MIIALGALTDKLSVQLKNTGIPHEELVKFDKLANALVMCSVWGIVSDSEVAKARQRIIKLINKAHKKAVEEFKNVCS